MIIRMNSKLIVARPFHRPADTDGVDLGRLIAERGPRSIVFRPAEARKVE